MNAGSRYRIVRDLRYGLRNGSPDVFWHVRSVDPGAPSIEKLVLEGNAITTDELQQWFIDFKIVGVENGFAAAEKGLAGLAHLLNLIRISRPSKVVVPSPPELIRFAAALQTMVTDGEALARMLTEALEIAGVDANQADVLRKQNTLDVIQSLRRLAINARAEPFLRAPDARRVRKAPFHDERLCVQFLIEQIAAQGDFTVSFGKDDSPAITLLVKALSRAGISDTPEACVKALKRAKGKPLPEIVRA